jgi:hypothetical protein
MMMMLMMTERAMMIMMMIIVQAVLYVISLSIFLSFFHYHHHHHQENTETTVGMEYAARSFDFEKSVILAQVWNTTGEARYDGMMKHYYRGAVACVLVYDIGCRDSFLNICKVWLKNVQSQGSEDLRFILGAVLLCLLVRRIVLCPSSSPSSSSLPSSSPSSSSCIYSVRMSPPVGNKIDIADKQQTLRQVTTEEGLELAKQLNVDFVETSALTGKWVYTHYISMSSSMVDISYLCICHHACLST